MQQLSLEAKTKKKGTASKREGNIQHSKERFSNSQLENGKREMRQIHNQPDPQSTGITVFGRR